MDLEKYNERKYVYCNQLKIFLTLLRFKHVYGFTTEHIFAKDVCVFEYNSSQISAISFVFLGNSF